MDRDMNILYILGVPLGYVMEWIYNLIPNYGCCLLYTSPSPRD